MASLTFYGTSDARGVPRMLCRCGVCSSSNPLNQRMRPSVCMQSAGGKTLIDVSPDFRQQFLRFENSEVPELVLITHAHFDHIGGLGDFADVSYWNDIATKIVSPPDIIDILRQRYPYLWNARKLDFHAAEEWQVGDTRVSFHKVNHGMNGYAYGIRFEGKNAAWGYMPDAFQGSEQQLAPFRQLKLLILGTAYWQEKNEPASRSIYDVQEALRLKQELAIDELVLTHLSHDIDVAVRAKELPAKVQFALDGMQLQLPL